MPSSNTTLYDRLNQKISSTVAELAAIREAIGYIIAQPPNSWCNFSDSRSTLESLSCYPIGGINVQLVLKTRAALQDATRCGHVVALQWIPSHCGLRSTHFAEKDAAAGHETSTLVL